MTGRRDPQQDGSIQAMLRDASLETSAELRGSLEQLRALLPDQPPAPRADLAALLAGGAGSPAAGTAPIPVDAGAEQTLPAGVTSLAERRRSRQRRLAVVGGAVIGAMTLGAGAVAASNEGFRHSVGLIFQTSGHSADGDHPASGPATVPAGPSPSDVPGLNPPTAAAETPSPAVIPPGEAPEAPTAPGAGAPETSFPAATPAAGLGGVLPAPDQRPSVPSLPRLPRETAPEETPDDPVSTLLNPGGFPPAG
ncbi:MAG TPA: hypothetical protein VFD99_06400 [Arthrobacter sp.]|jgi:hypothetical protein|nr:hypothetical protein [Arthrobacter sp.]